MIGIDLVNIPEFQRQLEVGGAGLLERVFDSSELHDRRIEHLAGLWAAKEAVWKANSGTTFASSEVVIFHDATGKPFARTPSGHFEVSISHHGEYAVAIALRVDS
jgi:phosphopantetheine--protein transferase-like protein